MTSHRLLRSIPYLFLSAFIIAPLLTTPHDMWDGTIIEYASETMQYEGLRMWFYESTWVLQFWFSLVVIKAAALIGITYVTLAHLLVALFLILLIRETTVLAREVFKLPSYWVIYAGCLTATFPMWHTLFSSVILFHLACILIAVFAIRLIHTKATSLQILGYFAIFLTFNFKSLLIFIPALSYVYDIATHLKTQNKFIFPRKETLIVFLLALVSYIGTTIYFTPSGIYGEHGYNELIITNIDGIIITLYQLKAFSTFLMPFSIAILFILAIGIFLKQLTKNKIRSLIERKILLTLFSLAILYFAAVFPYAAVGKGVALHQTYDWVGRQALLVVIPLSIFISYVLSTFSNITDHTVIKKSIKFSAIILLSLNCFFLANGVLEKTNRISFDLHLQKMVEADLQQIPPGLLQITSKSIPLPNYRTYEANMLVYRALNKSNWWTQISHTAKNEFKVPTYISQHPTYFTKYIYSPSQDSSPCSTVVKIKATGFTGYRNQLLNLFRQNSTVKVELTNTTEDCSTR